MMLSKIPNPVLGALVGIYRTGLGYFEQRELNGDAFIVSKAVKTVVEGAVWGFLWGMILSTPVEVLATTYLSRISREELFSAFNEVYKKRS